MAFVEVHMIDGGPPLIAFDAEVVFDGKENSVFVHKPGGEYTNVNWNYVMYYNVCRVLEDEDVKDLDD